MKLTNNDIYNLVSAGIGHLYYASLSPADALGCFRLRRQVVELYKEVDKRKNEELAKGLDKETIRKRLDEYGALGREIEIKQPIAFSSWLQLMRDNPWLAGFEEALAEFIQA